MERESFESKAVADFLSEHFISIKVDREERPDVDRMYMQYVQATTGGGGWPMTVFLTPELEPFLGGTYFPPEDKFGRPGFLSLLKKVQSVWGEREDDVRSGAQEALVTMQVRCATHRERLRAAPADGQRESRPLTPDALRARHSRHPSPPLE